jgi:hypothetical protein
MLAVTPLLLAIAISAFVSSTLATAAIFIVGAAVMAWLHFRYVPLIAD